MHFYSKYDLLAPVERQLSAIDKVDRVSYLDTNQQIRAFVSAGHSLALARAKALQGFYDGDETDDVPASPVFPVDPVDAARMSDVLQDELQARVSQRNSELAKAAERSAAANASDAVKSADEPVKS